MPIKGALAPLVDDVTRLAVGAASGVGRSGEREGRQSLSELVGPPGLREVSFHKER